MGWAIDRAEAVSRWFVILAIVVACGTGVLMLLSHPRSSTSVETAAPSRVAPVQSTEPAPDQEQAPSEEVAEPVATATASSPAATSGTFRGRLIDAVTRQPVKDFEVQMDRVQREPPWREEQPLTRTFQSESGRFSYDDVPADTWSVTIAAQGYQRFNLDEVTIVAGKKTREVVMPLLRGFTVRGRVVAASTGAAIPNAGVTYQLANGLPRIGVPQPDTRTKPDGTFVIDGMPGGDIVLTAGAEGYADRQVEFELDEKTPPQDFTLSAGGRISGIVTTSSGAPAKTSVNVSIGNRGYGGQSNDAGKFSFAQLPPGRYVVSVNGSASNARQEIVLGQDELRDDVALTVEGGRSIHGALKGLRPEQLKHAFIVLGVEAKRAHFSARPDEQGGYTINGVPAGQARVIVMTRQRQVERFVDVPADRDLTFDIVFPPGARLSGRVTRAGKPIWTSVSMRPADSKSIASFSVMTTADGAYEIEDLPAGEYRITAGDDVERVITISADAVLNIDIPSVQLGGRVVEDGSSIPLVGADVQIRGIDSATATVRGYKKTNDFGEFGLTGIEPGDLVLVVYMPGYELYREKISYAAPIKNKTIGLRKGSGVEIKVQRAASKEPIRVLTLGQTIPGNERDIYLWIPLNREGVGSMPRALAGSKLTIYGSGDGKPIIIEEWDGEPLELKL
jgi:hypothetical protein